MQLGYMRVSKADGSQVLDLQRDALLAAGAQPQHLYEDLASGRRDDRPGLTACLKALRPGDVLVFGNSTAQAGATRPTVWDAPRRGVILAPGRRGTGQSRTRALPAWPAHPKVAGFSGLEGRGTAPPGRPGPPPARRVAGASSLRRTALHRGLGLGRPVCGPQRGARDRHGSHSAGQVAAPRRSCARDAWA